MILYWFSILTMIICHVKFDKNLIIKNHINSNEQENSFGKVNHYEKEKC